MKWIGQHIWQFISRFRSDVYMEDLSSSSDTRILVANSTTGKISYNTSAGGKTLDQLLSDASFTISTTGENNLVLRTNGNMNFTIDHDNDSTNSFIWQNGAGTTLASMDESGFLDLRGGLGSTDGSGASAIPSKGDAASHVLVNSGTGAINQRTVGQLLDDIGGNNGSNITTGTVASGRIADLAASKITSGTFATARIADDAITFDKMQNITDARMLGNNSGSDGSVTEMTAANVRTFLNVADGATANTGDITGVTAGTNLSGGGDTGAVTINLADASESAKGAVELATTAEAADGTDTARAVTAAGVKSAIQANYSFQYLTFSFRAANIPPDCWVTPSQNGPEYFDWNNTHGSGQTQAASDAPSAVDLESTISVDYLDQPSGFIIPRQSKFMGFRGNCRVNGTNPNTLRPVIGFFRAAEPSDGNTSDVTATCIAFDKYDTASGNRKNRFLLLNSADDVSLSAGDLLFPAVGFDATASDSLGDIWGSFTIVLKTLMP